jgi:Xaa-Pro aminopeptidase
MVNEALVPSDPHDLLSMESLSHAQRDLLVQWFAMGLRETEIIGLAENHWNMILTRDDVRLLYATHRRAIAVCARRQAQVLVDSPHMEPTYVIQQLDILASRVAGMLDEAVEQGAVGPTDKLVQLYLRIIDRMQQVRKQLGVDDDTARTPIQEKLDKLPEGKRAEAISLLHRLQAIVAEAPPDDPEEIQL